MILSVMYRVMALTPWPPLRIPLLTACIGRAPKPLRDSPSGSVADGTAGALSDGTATAALAEPPGAPGPVSGSMGATCVSAESPVFRKRRFRNGVEPATADASQSQSRQIG